MGKCQIWSESREQKAQVNPKIILTWMREENVSKEGSLFIIKRKKLASPSQQPFYFCLLRIAFCFLVWIFRIPFRWRNTTVCQKIGTWAI